MVRDAVVGDEFQIAAVHVAAWRGGYAGLMPADYLAGLSVEAGAERWRGSLAEPVTGTQCLVAEEGGQVLGVTTFGVSRDDDASPTTGELWAINLAPASWGCGVGTALLTAAVDRLTAAGFRHATLWVLDGNVRARHFYDRRGWKPDGATKVDERTGFALHEVRYARSLPPG
ncbi:MAG: GNAT family N-acetyltransferase [Actinopolymorphaceae bacterium]